MICCWEFARLAVRGDIRVRTSVAVALGELLDAPGVVLQPITPEISIRAAQLSPHAPMDPADQLIAATALILRAPLVTSDERLQAIPGLRILW